MIAAVDVSRLPFNARMNNFGQLNRGEDPHKLARAVFHGKRGNIIILWNTLYMDAALQQLRGEGFPVNAEDVSRLSSLVFNHINLLGRYAFSVPESVQRGELRPLRSADDGREDVA